MKLIKVPFSGGCLGTNLGCEKAPDAVVEEMQNIWSSEYGRRLSFEADESGISNLKDGFVYIGGDHSITYYTLKDFSKKYRNPGLIIFDAHPDVYTKEKNVTHQDWLRFLIDEGVIEGKNVIIISVRNSDEEELSYIKEKGIRCYSMKDVRDIENTCDSVMESARNFGALYLSIDIDAVDPAFAPGTGYTEPGGLSSRELLYLVQRLKLLKNLKRADLVEINPDKDVNRMTVKLGAKIIAELITRP